MSKKKSDAAAAAATVDIARGDADVAAYINPDKHQAQLMEEIRQKLTGAVPPVTGRIPKHTGPKVKPADYVLTDEDRALMPAHAAEWLKFAYRTTPMSEMERAKASFHVAGLYAAAGLAPPRVVFVSNPFDARFIAGGAAGYLYAKKENMIDLLPQGTTPKGPIHPAVTAGIRAAIDPNGPVAGKGYVTIPAAVIPFQDKHYNSWQMYAADDAIASLHEFGLIEYMVKCAENAWGMHNGGNQYPGWAAFLSFFREKDNLDIDYAKWIHYEELAKFTGPRLMHADFCIVCDMPEVLSITEDNKPHCTTGPYLRYPDGSSMFAVNGTRVKAKYLVRPDLITDADRLEVERDPELKAALQPVWAERLNDEDLVRTFITGRAPAAGK